jgi:hypothetical protein
MPPTTVHFNGGVNLPDTETVMREIAARVPAGVRRIPDGETGSRQNWIFFQLEKFWQTPGLEQAGVMDTPSEGYEQMPKVRLSDGVEPADVRWADLGYADVYQDSYATFRRLRDEGVIPSSVQFQVQYPTPLASINGWVVPEDQDRLEPSYESALFADLDRLLAALHPTRSPSNGMSPSSSRSWRAASKEPPHRPWTASWSGSSAASTTFRTPCRSVCTCATATTSTSTSSSPNHWTSRSGCRTRWSPRPGGP